MREAEEQAVVFLLPEEPSKDVWIKCEQVIDRVPDIFSLLREGCRNQTLDIKGPRIPSSCSSSP